MEAGICTGGGVLSPASGIQDGVAHCRELQHQGTWGWKANKHAHAFNQSIRRVPIIKVGALQAHHTLATIP